MWKHYRKTLIPVQAFIFAAMAILHFGVHVDPRNLLMVFTVMQLGSVYGARIAARLKGQTDDPDVLPLAKRRA
jgi:uncharacterized membrane protein YfcA